MFMNILLLICWFLLELGMAFDSYDCPVMKLSEGPLCVWRFLVSMLGLADLTLVYEFEAQVGRVLASP